jgi:ubiquinol-cytochrome c reductase cytochrome b subunit
MMRRLRALGAWLDKRLKVSESLMPILRHPIPKGAAGPMGWWYVFGSASMTLLIVQILTGICLAMVYVPAADNAFASLEWLDYHTPGGWFLRALHYYAGSSMMVMVLAHMTQVFLHGAYKYPRELTWVVGVILLLCTLGMFFTGQVLRWDPDAYWGVAVGASMLHHPRGTPDLPRHPPVAGAQVRRQRPARARPGGRSEDLRRRVREGGGEGRPVPG